MRRPGAYPAPRYDDPNDMRMVRIIRAARHASPGAVNILGVPFDGAVLGRRGAAEGPAAIRESMAGFSNYNVEMGLGLEGARVFDLGDLVVGTDSVPKAHELIQAEVSRDLESSSILAILGGDNSVSLPSIRAFSEKFGQVGLIVIDSHFDLRGKIAGKPTSGSSYGLAIEGVEGVSPLRVVEMGIHGFLNSRTYFEKAKRLGVKVLTAKEVGEKGPDIAAKAAYDMASKGAQAVYLSVDLDAVDLTAVSGVSAPSAGGLAPQTLFDLVFAIARRGKVACADLVELAPSLDPTGRSQRVASTALMYLVAGFVSRTRH